MCEQLAVRASSQYSSHMPKTTRFGVWHELRVIRERTGWTAADLAKSASMSKGYLSDLENGHRFPNPRVIKQLSDALKVPYTVLERNRQAAS